MKSSHGQKSSNLKVFGHKCNGVYCDQAKDNIFFDENDDQFCLFIVQEEKQDDKLIPYKSIFLDLVERFKTIDNICKACPEISQNKVQNLPENLLFRLRKFYSIGDITASPLFHHLKVSNFYDQVRVCFYCSHVYDKIDAIRNELQHLLRRKRKPLDFTVIQKEMEKYLQGNTFTTSSPQLVLKTRMTQIFFSKLKDFDIDKELFFKDFQVRKTVTEKYFEKRLPKAQKNFFSLTTAQTNQEFQVLINLQWKLPVIYRYSLKDKDNLVNKKQFFVRPDQAEALGLKHYLGHVKNLPFSDQGLAISKSSLELNKLQDKIKEIEQLKERLENERVLKMRDEIELLMCTYYGNGKANRDRLADFVETLKKRECNSEIERPSQFGSSTKQIQIVTDKNDFLSDNQKKQKQDKEKKEIEIQESKKNFMELNSQLASSILRKGTSPLDSPLPLRQLDYISEDSEMY